MCFAALHAIGKYLEGSGVDSVSVEIGTYGPAALRSIFSGKAFKRGVEFHFTNILAITSLIFEKVNANGILDTMKAAFSDLKIGLHDKSGDASVLFNTICTLYDLNIKPLIGNDDFGEMGTFFINYKNQFECLLHIIRSVRQTDVDGYHESLYEQVTYYEAHDLNHYSRLVPVHIAQMLELKRNHPDTWDDLQNGDICVNKTGRLFSNLFVDQTLEQKNKDTQSSRGYMWYNTE